MQTVMLSAPYSPHYLLLSLLAPCLNQRKKTKKQKEGVLSTPFNVLNKHLIQMS